MKVRQLGARALLKNPKAIRRVSAALSLLPEGGSWGVGGFVVACHRSLFSSHQGCDADRQCCFDLLGADGVDMGADATCRVLDQFLSV